MKNMKLIMESWRKWFKKDFPADGHEPLPAVHFDTHQGGGTSQDPSSGEDGEMSKLLAKLNPMHAPIKNRNQVAIYPPPGKMFNPKTGEVDLEAAKESMIFLDQNAVQVKHEDDPYVDDWLEKTHSQFMAAIESLKEKAEQENIELEETLDAKFASAIESIRAIIKSRDEETLDTSEPDFENEETINDIPGNIKNI